MAADNNPSRKPPWLSHLSLSHFDLRDGCSPEKIAAIEKAFGIVVPTRYKDFLGFSDGVKVNLHDNRGDFYVELWPLGQPANDTTVANMNEVKGGSPLFAIGMLHFEEIGFVWNELAVDADDGPVWRYLHEESEVCLVARSSLAGPGLDYEPRIEGLLGDGRGGIEPALRRSERLPEGLGSESMALNWQHDDLVTHIGDDFLRCDIYDFGIREIRIGEVECVRYEARWIAFGWLPTIATVVLAAILWALIVGVRQGITWAEAVPVICGAGFFGAYVLERLWHCARNRRRVIALTLKDGTSGTLIELEDDGAFEEVRSIVDKYAKKQPGGAP